MTRLVLFGAGELGGAVGRRWVAAGGEAIAVTRTESRHPALHAAGLATTTADRPPTIRADDLIFLATPGSETQREVATALRDTPCARVVFASTTGFYTGWTGPVGPDSPPGDNDRARNAAAAEKAAQQITAEVVAVRFGGLYRHGRGPVHALLRRGAPPAGPPDRPLSLIHYDDAATATLAALHHPTPASAYIAVSPPLPTREAFYRYACDHHDLPAPTFTDPSGNATITYDVSNLRRDLLPSPAWPDWREAARG